jgi:hypothetical protein
MAAGVAANRTDMVTQTADALRAFDRTGRYVDGEQAALGCALAILERRWQDARAHYLAARRDLTAAGSAVWMAMLNLCVSVRAAGRFPEAADAAVAVDEFFDRVGARRFLDMYRARVLPIREDAAVKAEAEMSSRVSG